MQSQRKLVAIERHFYVDLRGFFDVLFCIAQLDDQVQCSSPFKLNELSSLVVSSTTLVEPANWLLSWAAKIDNF